MNEEKYIIGFNNGYLLAGHSPQLLNSVIKNNLPVNEYIKGLKDGSMQLEWEKINEQIKGLGNLRSRSNERGNEMER